MTDRGYSSISLSESSKFTSTVKMEIGKSIPNEEIAKKEFEEILERTIISASNVCFYGPAGTGKTEMLRQLYKALSTKYNVAVTTLTGRAAAELRRRFDNPHAKTLHRWSGCCLGVDDDEGKQERMNYYEEINKPDILLIDDFSMLSQYLFEKINKKCRNYRKCKNKIFGGIRLIIAGDPYSLTLIGLCDYGNPPCFESSNWKECSYFYENLQYPFRYKNEILWFNLLERIRCGKPTDSDIEIIKKREFEVSQVNETLNHHWKAYCTQETFELATYILGNNNYVAAHNAKQLEFIDSQVIDLRAHDIYDSELSSRVERVNKELDEVAPKIIQVKIGAFVVVTRNHRVDGDIVLNGTTGIISAIDDQYLIIDLLNDEKKKLKIHRYEYETNLSKNEDHGISRDYEIKRKQYPITLGYAMTVFKAQGVEFDKVAADLNNCWGPGHLYTALTRVEKYDNLMVTKETWEEPDYKKYSKNSDKFYKILEQQLDNDSGISLSQKQIDSNEMTEN